MTPAAPPAEPGAASPAEPGAALLGDYFDGVSARPWRVRLRLHQGALHLDRCDTDATARVVPLAEVEWPERTRHGARAAHFRSGGSVQALDPDAWDAWTRAARVRESAVVRAQQSWRSTFVAMLALVLLIGAGYQWGVPWLARGVLGVLPASVDQAIGDAALSSFDDWLLRPSAVSAPRQQQLREAFARIAQAADASGRQPAGTPYELRFHASPKRGGAADAKSLLGPNAFALPGGVIVVTDDMLQLLQGRDDVLLGVLGHELGHVRRRHGMRMLVQASLIATAASIAWGDFSSVLAAAPALLGQAAYSRDFEREADGDAIALLRAGGVSPAVMVELFERLAARRGTAGEAGGFELGIALASHPADVERMQRFRHAARH